MILDAHLAQQIVDRTMAIIGYNINVMNYAGVIIGSGDKNRIGEIHDGAILALQHGDSVELTTQSYASLKGVKPGINMVLRNNAEVVGIVGVTGEPDTIRDFAALVKMTAEMIIEQAALVEQLQWDRRHKEEFITAWISGQLNDSERDAWAARLSIDIHQPRVAVVIKFEQQNTPETLKSIRKAVELLEYPDRNNLVAVISMSEIVVLKPAHHPQQWTADKESQRMDRLIERLAENQISHFHIALGQFFPDVAQLPISYQSARQVLSAGRQFFPNQKKYLFEELRLPVLLSPLNQFWQGEMLISPVSRLKKQDKTGQLLKTLEVYFRCNGSLKDCADALFIHRNTLRYRLEKITEITGVSTIDLTGLMELYIATQLSKTM